MVNSAEVNLQVDGADKLLSRLCFVPSFISRRLQYCSHVIVNSC